MLAVVLAISAAICAYLVFKGLYILAIACILVGLIVGLLLDDNKGSSATVDQQIAHIRALVPSASEEAIRHALADSAGVEEAVKKLLQSPAESTTTDGPGAWVRGGDSLFEQKKQAIYAEARRKYRAKYGGGDAAN